jgi:thiol-disulfide isomerase/thioredoxin
MKGIMRMNQSFLSALFAIFLVLVSPPSQAEEGEAATEGEQNSRRAYREMLQTLTIDQVASFEEAKEEALANGQVLLVPLTAAWCGYCPSLIAEIRMALQTQPTLAARYLLHPVVVQFAEKINPNLPGYIDSTSGMNVAHLLFQPFADGSNLTFAQAITGWPTLIVFDPRSDLNTRIVSTGQFQVPQAEWKTGQYHSQTKITEFLSNFAFTRRCSSLF